MGLFSDIYNTVAKFFRPQEEQGDASKSVATNRLKLVLMQDRTNLTPKILEQMRGELIDLLSRYVELDKELLELNFEQEGEQVALMLSIPVIRAKDEEEIEAALKEANEGANTEGANTEGANTEGANTEGVNQEEDTEEATDEASKEGVGVNEKVDDNNDERSESSEEDTPVIDETEEENKTVSKPRKKRSAKSEEEAEEEITN